MGPFRKRRQEELDDVRVGLFADIEGSIFLEVDGVMCGKVTRNGEMVVTCSPLGNQLQDATIGLLLLFSVWPDEKVIAEEIARLRRKIRQKKRFGQRRAAVEREDPEREELSERDRAFVKTFFDLDRVEEYASLMDRARKLALVAALRGENLTATPRPAIPEVRSGEDILIVHTVSVDASVPESESCIHQLSMSRPGGLAPIHARFLFALASVRFALPRPEAVFRSAAGVWHAKWLTPRSALAATPTDLDLEKSAPLGDSFELALESAWRIAIGDVDIKMPESIAH